MSVNNSIFILMGLLFFTKKIDIHLLVHTNYYSPCNKISFSRHLIYELQNNALNSLIIISPPPTPSLREGAEVQGASPPEPGTGMIK